MSLTMDVGEMPGAKCLELDDPEVMFPDKMDGPGNERAKQVCAGCPTRDRCLEMALRTRQHYGVWGGLSEDERVALRRRDPVGLGAA